nr:hypothetical protein [Mycolicibacterium hippocampi]
MGAYGCQVHHAAADWADGGNTNVDEMGLACGPDNRAVDTDGGWRTRMNERCEVEWIPPPPLDTGQTRINYQHRPEALLRPDELQPQSPNNAGEPRDRERVDPQSVEDDRDDPQPIDPEPGNPSPINNAGEPGGPAPPHQQAA